MAITETELRDKVGKLMAMAGTEGGAYAQWTVNQIVHGLRNVAPGVRAPGVELALKQLELSGIVRCVDPGDPGKKAARWVRIVKIETPEHMEVSPFDQMKAFVKESLGSGGNGQEEVVVDPEENEDREPEPMSPAVAGLAEAAEVENLASRIDGLTAIVRGVVQRSDNLEEVMQTLNGLVGTMQEHFKNKLRADKESASRVKFDLADYKRLERRVVKLEKLETQFEEIVDLLQQMVGFGKEIKGQIEDDGVGVVAVGGRDRSKAIREVEELAHEWLKGGDSSMASDLAKRGCGATILQVLAKHGVLSDEEA